MSRTGNDANMASTGGVKNFLTSSKLKLAASDVLIIRQSFSLQYMADGIV